MQVLLDGHVDVGVLRRPTTQRARRGDTAPLVTRDPFQERHRGQPERLAHLLQQARQRVGPGEHRAGERGEQRALRAGPLGLLRPSGGPVDDEGHQHPDDDHRGERDDVLRLGDREGVERRGEEEVEEQAAQQRRQERGAEPTHQRRDDRGQEVEHHVRGQADHLLEEHAQPGRRDGQHDGQPPAQHPAHLREGPAQGGQSDAAARLVVGDHVHVDGAGVRRDTRADALDEHPREPGAPRGAEHELGGVGAAGEVEQRRRHVLAAHHGVEARADVLGQAPQLGIAAAGVPTSPSCAATWTARRSAPASAWRSARRAAAPSRSPCRRSARRPRARGSPRPPTLCSVR